MNKTRHQIIDGCKNFKPLKLKSQYKTIYEWKKANPNNYENAYRKGLTSLICEYYGWEPPNSKRKNPKPSGYWTKERCIEEAKPYPTRKQWMLNQESSYQKARVMGWLDECCAHMTNPQKESGYWNNKNRCLEEARKYKTRTEWQKATGPSFLGAKRNGWLDECTAHMPKAKFRKKGYWDKNKAIKSIFKCKNKTEWGKNFYGAFNYCRKYNLLDEIYSLRGWEPKQK